MKRLSSKGMKRPDHAFERGLLHPAQAAHPDNHAYQESS